MTCRYLSSVAVSSKLEVYLTQILLRITGSPVFSIQEGATTNTFARRTSRGEKNVRIWSLMCCQPSRKKWEISLLLNWEGRWGTKADCAVKRMCRNQKNHELLAHKTHREAKAVLLGRRKTSPLFLHSCTHSLFTFRWTNCVIFLISEKLIFSVSVSKRPASSLHRVGGQRKKGLSQTLCEDAVTAGVELHSLNGSAAATFCNARAQQRTHLFVCVFMTCFGIPLLCPFFGRVEGREVLRNTCIHIMCVLQKITRGIFSKGCLLESFWILKKCIYF